MQWRVVRENPAASGLSRSGSGCIAGVSQAGNGFVGSSGDPNFGPGLKELVETFPPVADDRHSTTSGLEETHTGRVAPPLHLGARDVQREALGGVEAGVFLRSEVIVPVDIGGPP
jgi:hypothetical protein